LLQLARNNYSDSGVKRRVILMALWAVLMAPFALLAASTGGDPDALVAASGNWAVAWLALAVVMAPLARLWRGLARWLWLRRAVGLAAFGGSVVHLWLYVLAMRGFAEPGGEWALIADEAFTPGMLTGWLALALLLLPAIASNDAMLRFLRQGWKPVQRLAWPAAGLAIVHMAVVHDGFSLALAVGGVIAGLQMARFFPVRSTRKAI
jgi:sulfoxide reductase heme-binding subunit YedZ